MEAWLTDATNHASPNTVIFLIGNKADLEDQVNFVCSFENYSCSVMYPPKKHENSLANTDFISAKLLVSYIMRAQCDSISAKTGENVEEAFLETARQIYQKIQEGSLELNAADSGVQTRAQVRVLRVALIAQI